MGLQSARPNHDRVRRDDGIVIPDESRLPDRLIGPQAPPRKESRRKNQPLLHQASPTRAAAFFVSLQERFTMLVGHLRLRGLRGRQIFLRFGQGGVKPQRLLILLHRLIDVTTLVQCTAEIVPRPSGRRDEGPRLVEIPSPPALSSLSARRPCRATSSPPHRSDRSPAPVFNCAIASSYRPRCIKGCSQGWHEPVRYRVRFVAPFHTARSRPAHRCPPSASCPDC